MRCAGRWMLRFAEIRASAAATAAAVATALERALLPAECLLCTAPLGPRDAQPPVCRVCRLRWTPVPRPLCERCGQPRLGALECRLCAEWAPGLDRARSAVWLEDGARDVVHRLKYEGWWRVADAMAEAMRGLEPLTVPLFLVPIPLGARRLRARGYNQSARLAEALARLTGGAVADVLRRSRETGTQTALTPEGRHANVAGAFATTRVPPGRCVLVDDVFTTGATLCAAAAALRDRGAEAVEAVTFARAAPPVR